jgi:hypothetical protein
MELRQVVEDLADALVAVDGSRVPFKQFQPGVGPYGEPQLLHGVVRHLKSLSAYREARTTRTPDLLIPQRWALEFKLARPFGNNGKEAENWAINLLHPYEGNVSLIGDCLKLERLNGPERKAAMVIGYEHCPSQISLLPLLASFELIAGQVVGVKLGPRVQVTRVGLIHPVHQQFTIAAWEVLPRPGRGPNGRIGPSPPRLTSKGAEPNAR